jgi:hypothetical protein
VPASLCRSLQGSHDGSTTPVARLLHFQAGPGAAARPNSPGAASSHPSTSRQGSSLRDRDGAASDLAVSEGTRAMRHLEDSLERPSATDACLQHAASLHMSDGHSDIASSMYNHAPSMTDDAEPAPGTSAGVHELPEIPEAPHPGAAAELNDTTELPPMDGPVPTTNRPEINHADLARTGIRFGKMTQSCVAEAASTTNQSERGSEDAGTGPHRGLPHRRTSGTPPPAMGGLPAGSSPLATASDLRRSGSVVDMEGVMGVSDGVSDDGHGRSASLAASSRSSSAAGGRGGAGGHGDHENNGDGGGSDVDDHQLHVDDEDADNDGAGPGPATEANFERIARQMQRIQDELDAATLNARLLPQALRHQMQELGRRGGLPPAEPGTMPGTPDLKAQLAAAQVPTTGSNQAIGRMLRFSLVTNNLW